MRKMHSTYSVLSSASTGVPCEAEFCMARRGCSSAVRYCGAVQATSEDAQLVMDWFSTNFRRGLGLAGTANSTRLCAHCLPTTCVTMAFVLLESRIDSSGMLASTSAL